MTEAGVSVFTLGFFFFFGEQSFVTGRAISCLNSVSTYIVLAAFRVGEARLIRWISFVRGVIFAAVF